MDHFEFNPQSTRLDFLNALRLAELSHMAYGTEKQIEEFVRTKCRLTGFQFLDIHDTQILVASDDKAVLLSFRGTSSTQDWMTDAKIRLVLASNGRVHRGFDQALDVVWEDVYQATRKQQTQDQTVWVTGHSLGGALATLAVQRFIDDGVVAVQGLYTYGQPMAGDKEFARSFDEKMKDKTFRFVHDEDIVTRLPGKFLPYRHIGAECYFDRKDAFYAENIGWHKFLSRGESVAIRSSEDAGDSKALNPGGILDHGMNHYIRCIRQHLHRQSDPPVTFLDYINR